MTRWLTRRLIVSVITMIGFSVLVFVLIRMAPSDPVDLMLSRQRTGGLVGEALLRYKAQLRADLGLDQPLPLQYLYWVREILLHGNFGYSIMSDQPAADFLLQRLPATLLLMTCSLLFAFVVGIPLGIVSAVYRGRPLDGVVSAASLAVVAIPTFFLGLTLLYVFAANLHWLPSGGLATPGSDPDVVDIGRHLVLPVVVLGGASAGVVARYVRASILDTLGREYLMTARSKGLSGRVVLIRHALPNALLPVITLVGLSIGALAAGAFVVEQLFAWPGMGRIALKAITDRDYPVIQAFALLTGFMVLLGSLVADVGYAIADPEDPPRMTVADVEPVTLAGSRGSLATLRGRARRMLGWAAEHRGASVGMLILLVMSLMAIGAGLISPQDPTRVNVANQFQPPSAEHLLGTDRLGRDLWTRLLYAGRISLAVGLSAALVATSIGVVIGLVAGLAGGRVDAVLMRLTDVVLALPSLIIIAVVSSIFGRGMEVIVLFIGLVGWTDCARVVRGLTLSLRELDFVHAAQTMGASSWWIMRRHLLWHIVPVLTVTASFAVAFAILTEAALSFLGIGAPAPLFSWGSMLTDASDITILTQRPWYWLPPGLAVIVTVLAVTMVGEGIRDALNPQERRA